MAADPVCSDTVQKLLDMIDPVRCAKCGEAISPLLIQCDDGVVVICSNASCRHVGRLIMKYCKTCDWWVEIESEHERREYHFRQDTSSGEWIPLRQKDCKCPKIVDVSDNVAWASLPDDAAGYRDCEDYGAIFRPGPEFGCVHHKAKEGKRSIRTEEGELRCREASEFCDGPAGAAPEPDCEKAIYLLRELVAYIERE